MSGAAQVDYDALAKQHGGSAGVDYDALAQQHGGASNAQPSTPPPPQETIGPRTGAGAWLQDLESDIRHGTGATFVGRILQGMGAEGTSEGVPEKVGDYMASPVLGTAQAARGATEIGSHPLRGAKDIGAGILKASQIPASLAAGPGEEAAATGMAKAGEAIQVSREASQAAKASEQTVQEWQRINAAIGAGAKSVRIGNQATSLEQAATMPGRALSKLGYTADELEKMTPIERMATIAPHYQQAGAAIDAATQGATDAGKTLDAGKSAFAVLRRISNPKLQEQSVQALNDLGKSLDDPITNWRAVTPRQALQLRRSLQAGARFGPSGDLNSLSSIRAQLYGAVSSDLHDAVPSLQPLDQNYSDLKSAIVAAKNSVQKAAAKGPSPSMWEQAKARVVKEAIPAAVRYGVGGALGYGAYRVLKDTLGP